MSTNPLRYDRLIEEALRGVVRRALREVADVGDLPGSHHFYITFKTTAAGVSLADRLREKYPDEMTIVLQYQFWALEVAADHFAVTLKFDNVPERLVIPFAAVTAFADPAAKFGFAWPSGRHVADHVEGDELREPLVAVNANIARPACSGQERPRAGEVLLGQELDCARSCLGCAGATRRRHRPQGP
jgi:hypothetical protein